MIFVSAGLSTQAQTTEFTYQGQLQSSAAPASGNFDFEFLLFDAPAGGSQVGGTVTKSSVPVANGSFSVSLDFGSSFPGAARFLEIRVRQTGGGALTPLSPRQPISSAPYSIKSLAADTAINAVNATNATTAVNATNAANLTGSLAGDVTGTQGATTVARLQTRSVANTAPVDGQVLKFNAANNRWQPDTDNSSAGGVTSVTASGPLTSNGGVTPNISLGLVPTTNIADAAVTDAKINTVSGAKVTGTVANATNATTATNATQLGGLPAGQYVITTDPRMTNERQPAAGSANYIQNGTAEQPVSNFNVSGNGTAAGTLSANTLSGNFVNALRYNINGNRVLSTGPSGSFFAGPNAGAVNTGGQNSFFGNSAGAANTTANQNSFFGNQAGLGNTTAGNNSFFGNQAGFANTTGATNSFFGAVAGSANTTAGQNSFFGAAAGQNNTTGANNAFFGAFAGSVNSTANQNSFFGNQAGLSNTTGATNSFFGAFAGSANTTAGNNSFFGNSAGQNNTTGANNAFFGAFAGSVNSTANQNSFFGNSAGLSNTTGTRNSFFGADAGSHNTTGGSNVFLASLAGQNNTTGVQNTFVGELAGGFNITGSNNTIIGYNSDAFGGNLNNATAIGANAIVTQSNSMVLGDNVNVGIGNSAPADKLDVDGDIRVGTSGTNGCLKNNNGGTITGTCSSDIRFKQRIIPFSGMLDKVGGLSPVNYYWRASEFPNKRFGNAQEYGLIAQDVERVLPELVSEDPQGYKQVDYSKLPLMTIQAVKELKLKMEEQQTQIEKQQKQIETLTKLVCTINKEADICKEK